MSRGVICMSEFYKKGDPTPEGYIAWHDWARIQYNAGLRQGKCPHGKWLFPQEVPCDHDGTEK